MFLRQVMSDIRQGIIKRWYLYLIVFIISVITAEIFYVRYIKLFADGRIDVSPGVSDCILYFFRGMREYRMQYKEAFDVPAEFLVWNLVTAYIVGDYPLRELSATGAARILRSGRRDFWWYSKCVFNLLSVVMVYVSVYMGVITVSVLNGAEFKKCENLIFKRIFMTDMPSSEGIIMRVIITAFMSLAALSMLQMFMAFIAGNVAGYALVVIMCVISAYYMKWPFFGNGMMIYRYDLVNPDGITAILPVVWYVLVIVVCIVAGRYVFERKDIM